MAKAGFHKAPLRSTGSQAIVNVELDGEDHLNLSVTDDRQIPHHSEHSNTVLTFKRIFGSAMVGRGIYTPFSSR